MLMTSWIRYWKDTWFNQSAHPTVLVKSCWVPHHLSGLNWMVSSRKLHPIIQNLACDYSDMSLCMGNTHSQLYKSVNDVDALTLYYWKLDSIWGDSSLDLSHNPTKNVPLPLKYLVELWVRLDTVSSCCGNGKLDMTLAQPTSHPQYSLNPSACHGYNQPGSIKVVRSTSSCACTSTLLELCIWYCFMTQYQQYLIEI